MKEQLNRMIIGHYKATNYGWALQEIKLLLKPYLKAIGNLTGKKVLDVGCGSGWITKLLAQKAFQVTGIDVSEGMITRARQENAENNIFYKVLDASRLASLNESFDVITSSLMVHAAKSKTLMIKTLKACSQSLKSNGKLVILIPHPCFSNVNKRAYNTYTFLNKFNYFKKNQQYKVTLRSSRGKTEFFNVFYNLQDYFDAFAQSGLVVSNVIEPQVSGQEQKKHSELWSTELENPFYIIFVLSKNHNLKGGSK